MQGTIQMVITPAKGPTDTREMACREREDLTPATVGLTRAAGKTILKARHAVVVEQPMTAYRETPRPCADGGSHQRRTGYHTRHVRTVFGPISVQSPRLPQCACQPHPTKTFSPRVAVLPEHLTPE